MSLLRIQTIVFGAWLAVMLVVVGTSLALGVVATPMQVVGWLVLGCVPPSVLIMLIHRGQVHSMSQVSARAGSARRPAGIVPPKEVRE